MKIPAPVSLVMLLAMTLVCSAYMAVAVLDIDPRRVTNTITVLVDSSGGLMETSEVDLRGMKIGRVQQISTTADGLAVEIEVDAAYPIPVDSEVRIGNLSAAGEQYLDFRPPSADGPYLDDGAIVPATQVKASATVSDTLTKIDSLTGQLDAATLERLVTTVSVGNKGREADIANLSRATMLFAQMLQDKKDPITRLYVNLQTLGDNFDGYGSVLGDTTPVVSALTPNGVQIIQEFEEYSHVAEHVWDHPIGPLVAKIGEYLDILAPDLALVSTVVKPATSQLRPLRVDLGSIMNILLTVFPDGGPARVAVAVPNR
ncbi:MlaD family protein [Antrihabitans spumae]|uniref:MlaD family protein n=1 Tax=Antrihabitans spumae TaxID=3373370 RepID=A0ABW7KH37_9NOCA